MRVVGPRAMVSDLLDAELPWSLEEAVRQQLAGLEHGRRRVVEALAVYGRAASFEALLVVTEADEADLLGALRSLVDAGVVVEVSDDQFWFSHALVADAIVHQLLGRERRRLHERCFEAVRRAPVLDHASLAYHAQGADRHDEVPGDRPARRGALPREGADVLGPAPRRRGAGRGAERPRAAGRRHRGGVAPRLRAPRRSTTAIALGEGRRRAARPHRRAALRRPAAPRARRRAGVASARSPSSRSCGRRSTIVAAARRRRVVARPGAHDQRTGPPTPSTWAERALADARAVGDTLTEARALVERAGASVDRQSAARSRSTRSTRRSTRPAAPATPCCSRGRSTTASSWCRRTRPRPPRCGPRCRTSARASASTSSARRRRWCGSSRPPSAAATCRCCAGSPPRARSGGAGTARAQVDLVGAGRLRPRGGSAADAAEALRRASSTACPAHEAPALPPPRDRAGRGPRRS